MSVKEIPNKYIHTCDMCKKQRESSSQGYLYRWGECNIDRHGYDYQGNAVGPAGRTLYMCLDCLDNLEVFLERGCGN